MNSNVSRRQTFKLGAAAFVAGAAVVGEGKTSCAYATELSADVQGAGVYRFKIGEIDAALVSDGTFPFPPGGHPLFGANTTKEQVKDALDAAFVPPEHIVAHVNCLALRTPKGVVLVDSGCGALFGPTTGKALAHLAALGIKPADVSAVIITHAHADHVGGLLAADSGKPVFSNAQHFIHEDEEKFWADGNPDLSKSPADPEMKKMIATTAAKTIAALKGKLETFGDKRRIVEGVEVVPAVGHTPGHVGLLIASGDAQLLYVTDAAHHYAINFPHPDWHVAFDTDPALAAKSRRALLDRAAADRVLVSGSHLPFPAVGHVKQVGSGFDWVPAIWEW